MILIYFLIAISLSIDAFSLSLSLGTTSPKKDIVLKMSIIVGLFHFIMPILGSLIGNLFIIDYSNIIIFIIFIILIIEMLFNNNDSDIKVLNIINIIIIAFIVSIDSFTVGIAIGLNKELILIPSLIFSLISTISTYIGLTTGKYLNNKYQDKSKYIGIIILLIVALKYLFS